MVTHKTQQAPPKNAYQTFYEQTSPVMGYDGALEEHDDDIAMGVAMDTRNYQELLKQAGSAAAFIPEAHTVRGNNNMSGLDQRRRSSQPQSPPPLGPPPRFSVLLGNNNNSAESDDESPIMGEAVCTDSVDEEVIIDHTVRGLPVETRNYEAFAGGASSFRHPPPVKTPTVKPRFPIKSALSDNNNVDDDEAADAVHGLPISSGNYAAIVGAGVKVKKGRSRGYSDQAGVAERRASAPAHASGARPPAQHATAPAAARDTTGPGRNSCFETRRATSVAVMPFNGWLYIQSSTFKSWKKQYAVLSGAEFKHSKVPGQSPKGFGTVQAAQQWSGMTHGIMLLLASGKQLPVHCESAAEYESWMHAFQKSLDKLQHLSGYSKTSYTVTTSEQHEGFLYKQEPRASAWRRHYFVARVDGYIECKVTEDASSIDGRNSGYIKSVSFADVHPHGLAIQLDSGTSVLVYADTYDERMLWYAAMSSAALANNRTPQGPASSVKSTYVQTARANHAGWMHKQAGLFKSWKRFYFTLHGAEVSFAKDANAGIVLCDKVQAVEDWTGKQNGLQIKLISGRVWRVYADSYDSAKRWRTLMQNATRQGGDNFNAKRYLASRKRKGLAPVFGGWLTHVRGSGVKLRQFYIVEGDTIGVASEVDHQLQPIGRVVDVGASRDLNCGIVVSLANGVKLKLAVDSVDSHKSWYEILKASL